MSTPDRASPKYVTIADDLRDRIARGELEAGSRLPSQQDLADAHGVTLMTLRQALRALTDEGLVTATPGRGTFVASPTFEYGLGSLDSFAQVLARQGIALTTLVVSSGPARAGTEVAEHLDLAPGDEIFALERLRLVAGRPVLYQRSSLPLPLGAALDVADLERRSLYDVLREEHGVEVVRARETLRPVVLGQAVAEHLDRPVGAPALRSDRLSLSAEGPVLADRALLPGDAVVVTAERVPDRLSLGYQLL